MADKKTIFLSYCHKDKDSADIIDKELEKDGISIRRDERDVGYKDSFKGFMKKIREADHAVMLLSEDFLRSANCMYEMTELIKEEDFKKRVLPVMVKPLSIFNTKGRIDLVKYWQGEEAKLKIEVKGIDPVNLGPLTEDLRKAQEISSSISSFVTIMSDMKLVNLEDLRKNGYRDMGL